MIEFDLSLVQVLTLLVGVISPILVGLVTTKVTGSGTKAVLLLALSAVTGLGGELIDSLNANETYDLGAGLLLAVTSFLVGVAMHFGLWKPTGVSEKAQNSLVGSGVHTA